MAIIHIDPRTVRVRFTRAEKIAGLLRDIEVPRAAVTSATVEAYGLRAAKGIRAPGLAVPWVRKIGTWRRRGQRTVVCVRRGEPALSLRLHGTRWDQLLIGTTDASSLAARLSGE